jgi:hypothetical protein
MHDYKHHRPARRVPEWVKLTIGLALGLPFLWLWAAVMLSF